MSPGSVFLAAALAAFFLLAQSHASGQEPADNAAADSTGLQSTEAPANEQGFAETEPPQVEIFVEEGAAGKPEGGTAAPGSAEPEPGEQPAYWKEIVKGLGRNENEPGGSAEGGQAGAPEGAAGVPQPVGSGVSYLKALSALCIVLAVILICYYLVKRYGKGSPLFAGSNLATVLGRVYLDPRSALHFIRVGSRILVVGVTRNGISRVAEFDAEVLQSGAAPTEAPEATDEQPADFASHLRERTVSMLERESAREEDFDDSELVSLRDDIQRLQKSLREPSGENDSE